MEQGPTKGDPFLAFLELAKRTLGAPAAETLCRELGIPSQFKPSLFYPIDHLVGMQELAIPRLWPGRAVPEGMRELGHLAFQTFADSAVGKVVLTLFGRDFQKLAERIPRQHADTNHFGSVTLAKHQAASFRLEYRDYRHYPAYHHDLIRCAMESCGHRSDLALDTRGFESRGRGVVWADFDLQVRLLKQR